MVQENHKEMLLAMILCEYIKPTSWDITYAKDCIADNWWKCDMPAMLKEFSNELKIRMN